jgi:hypothetical protein
VDMMQVSHTAPDPQKRLMRDVPCHHARSQHASHLRTPALSRLKALTLSFPVLLTVAPQQRSPTTPPPHIANSHTAPPLRLNCPQPSPPPPMRALPKRATAHHASPSPPSAPPPQTCYSLGLEAGLLADMPDTERLALLVAALCHDLEHPVRPPFIHPSPEAWMFTDVPMHESAFLRQRTDSH